MPADIVIRNAVPKEAARLAVLSRRTFIDAFAALNNPEDFNAYVENAFTRDRIASEMNDPFCTFFVAETGHEWAGYAKLHQSCPPDCVTPLPAIELSRLYSRQEFLGCGVGKALLDACIRHAKVHGFRSLWLGSWMKNHRGNAFYRKTGFEIRGVKTFTVGSDVQQDHVFVRPLD